MADDVGAAVAAGSAPLTPTSDAADEWLPSRGLCGGCASAASDTRLLNSRVSSRPSRSHCTIESEMLTSVSSASVLSVASCSLDSVRLTEERVSRDRSSHVAVKMPLPSRSQS
eukprot:6163678-Pleurochrysis_carterae.AAC.3